MNEYTFKELEIGHEESFEACITEEMEDNFRVLTGDINPLHQDDMFALQIGNGGRFKKHISFGMLTAGFYSTLAGVYLPGKYSLIHSLEIKFLKPVFAGDHLTIRGVLTEKQEELRLIQVKAKIVNVNNQSVSKAKLKIIVLK